MFNPTPEFELEPGEKVILVVRKHWLILIGYAIAYAFIAWLPILLLDYIAGGTFGATYDFTKYLALDNKWVRFILGTWWLFTWFKFFSAFTRFFLNQWVITSTRIVDIEQTGYFRREVSSVPLARVQDVTTNITGFFHTIFGFGTVEVQSAGAEEKFVMTGLERPTHIRDTIMREIAEYNKAHPH
ncbi:MAG: hypothetical protein ABA06_00550 [Parcubacteria bacterium C7867-001]|nr:MAG: hypothetical protein ABA06_00550 [Parcubacteria bacterium C7867-001]